jgi:hypothetical protein
VDLRCALNDILQARGQIMGARHGLGDARDWTARQLSVAADQVQLALASPPPVCSPPVDPCGLIPHPVFYHGYPVCQ